jgi:anti-anti-sigma regulatory factor
VLVGLNPTIRGVMEILRLDKAFEVKHTVDEVLQGSS